MENINDNKMNKPLCAFCETDEDDIYDYGELMCTGNICAHYFCTLLSYRIEQLGEDNEGIYGFLECDIIKELERGKRSICSICLKSGTTLQCARRNCKKKFHLPCHIKSNLHIDFTTFNVYCRSHSYQSNIKLRNALKNGCNEICAICQELICDEKIIINKCCGKFLHKYCAKQLAHNSGYFTKCPTCNSTQIFIDHLQKNGVFVPYRDASWELEENAFQELEYVYKHCDATQCKCPHGRDFDRNRWQLVRCSHCGSSTVHKKCASIVKEYICSNCQL